MTDLLDLEGIKVIDYRLIEGIGIVLSLENTKKKVLCQKCGHTTDRVQTNNYQLVRPISFLLATNGRS